MVVGPHAQEGRRPRARAIFAVGPGKDGDGARGARGVFDSEAEREAGGCGLVGPALIDAGRRGVTMTWLGFGLGSGES